MAIAGLIPLPYPVRSSCELQPVVRRVIAAPFFTPLGAAAALIGTVREDPHHFVTMETLFGGNRLVDWLSGEQLPRIC